MKSKWTFLSTFLSWWAGTLMYIFVAAILPDSRVWLDLLADVFREIKKYWVDYIIHYLLVFRSFITGFFS